MHDIAAPPDQTLAPLWDRARARLARAVAAIGAPDAIAALRALTPALRRAVLDWLAPLERIVRALLLAQAAAIARARPLPLPSAAAKRKAGAAPAPSRALDRSNPETWPARFALSPPRDPRRVPDARAPRIRALWDETPPSPPPAPRPRSEADGAFRLALRLEAVRRVLADPAPHALRLARLVTRAVRRFPEIAARYLFAHGRIGGCDGGDPRLLVDVLARAMDAPYAFPDSS